ncbi:MAG TPA: 4'-phosphopantetheinyl transferase superfamily protein [Phycisphaerae bacterium]|nr:4'-phosphopantetheinyl transferase superfamily protein [Phycisphaerae bacterium]
MIRSKLERISIPDTGIEVWLARLDLDINVVSHYISLLSPDEQERAQRFHFEHDRRRFIVARGTLRILLGKHLVIDPKAIRFAQTEKGKPLITNMTIHFNVSHSHERALIAISNVKPVGVDIEYLAREVDYEALTDRYFTPNEYATLQSFPEEQRKHVFLTCWTCKEAIAKARGEGLFMSLDNFEVISLPALKATHHAGGCALHRIEVDNCYIATIAVLHQQ